MSSVRSILASQAWYQMLSDQKYALLTRVSPTLNTKLRWKQVYHRRLVLDEPELYCDKQAWLKLKIYNHSPFVKRLAHKVLARQYVESKGLKHALIDLYGVWDHIDDIPFNDLPGRFILKTAMGCGHHVVCRDPSRFDAEQAKEQLRKAWSDKSWLMYGELQYKPERGIRQQVFCERLLHTEDGGAPVDYKFNCFHGEPLFIDYCFDRAENGGARFKAMDMDWTYHPEWTVSFHPEEAEKPVCFEEMCEIARILSKGIPFVRIDLYEEDGRPRFGEFTFTPSGGLDTDYPMERQIEWGKRIRLDDIDTELLEIR